MIPANESAWTVRRSRSSSVDIVVVDQTGLLAACNITLKITAPRIAHKKVLAMRARPGELLSACLEISRMTA